MSSSQRWAVQGVAGSIAAGCVVVAILGLGLGSSLELVVLGLIVGTLIGQTALAAAWNALGPLSLKRRLPLSLAWVASLLVAITISYAWTGSAVPLLAAAAAFAGILVTPWLLVQLGLSYFVFARGWRLRNRTDAIPDVKLARNGVPPLLLLVAAIGALLIAGWATISYFVSEKIYGTPREITVQLLVAVPTLLLTVALVLGVLLPRGAVLATTAIVMLWTAATAGVMSILQVIENSIGPPGSTWVLAVTNGTIAAWICIVGFFLRLGGYSLGTTKAPVRTAVAMRFWPRFSLRTLLIAVTVLGVALGYVGTLLVRVRHQRQVVASIEAAGGKVIYDYQFLMEAELDYTLNPDDSKQWINSNSDGKRVRYRRDAQGRTIEKQVETPPGPRVARRLLGEDIFAYVEGVSFFWQGDSVGQVDPRQLLELPRLKVVVPTASQVNDEWLQTLAQVPQLRCLHLAGGTKGIATKDGLARLQSARQLESLHLSGEWVQDETVAGISRLKQLKALGFGHVPNLSSQAFAYVNELTELRELALVGARKIDDQHTVHLAKLTNLRSLWLRDTSVSDKTLAHVSSLTQLECLDVSQTNVGDTGVECLIGLSKLKRLNLSRTNVGDAGLESIAKLRRLQVLDLAGTKITDAGMRSISQLDHVKSLDLYPSTVTDARLIQLKSLKELQTLDIGPHITKEAADELRSALPQCKIRLFDASGLSVN